MFESHKKYNSNNRRYTKKKQNTYYTHSSSNKTRTKKRKGSLKELEDNFTYQTTPTTETKLEKEQTTEVTEFLLEPENENEANKENISSYANKQPNPIVKDSVSSSMSSSSSQSSNSPCINLSNESLQEAYYFPKKLSNIYTYIYNQMQLQCKMYKTPQVYPLPPVNPHTPGPNPYSRHSSSGSVIPPTTSPNVSPFCYYDTPFSANTTYSPPGRRLPSSSMNLNLNAIHIGSSSLDKENEKEKENTDILSINIKVSDEDNLVFKIRRYDDMFKTVKIFCEINKLEPKYIRPLILYIIKALNGIYGIVNLKLSEEEKKFLCGLKEKIV